MRALALRLAAAGLLTVSTAASAVQPSEQLTDPALEKRAREISAGLRCLVCQNQSIDDSDAPLAADLRVLVRQRLTAGDSDESVRDYLLARYGDFILLRPRFSASTLLLWLTPAIALLAGALVAVARARRARSGGGEALTSEEEAQLAHILQAEGRSPKSG